MGKYAVARELYAQGSYMTAYEAVQEGLGKKVEIRLLAQKAGEASTELARFQAEIRNLANLDHPSILRVLDCGLINGKLYYVTDLKSAPNLQDALAADPPLSLDDKVKIGIQVASALRYMHARGIIHRGLTPTAVNFDATVGLAYISQFFFMKNMNTDSLTVRGIGPIFSMLGTPEAILGEPTDARTDVFLLGCPYVPDASGSGGLSSGPVSGAHRGESRAAAREAPARCGPASAGSVGTRGESRHLASGG